MPLDLCNPCEDCNPEVAGRSEATFRPAALRALCMIVDALAAGGVAQNVTVTNGAGAEAVNIQDGGNSITTDSLAQHAEDSPVVSGDIGIGILGKILATPASQAADSDYGLPLLNELSILYNDGVRRVAFVHTNPTVANASPVNILAPNAARRYFLVQNNSAATIALNLNNENVTGLVPSATNKIILLVAGATYESPPNACPVTGVVAYQTSGGSINTISVVEQS